MVAWSGFILPTSQLSSGWHHIAREAYDNNNINILDSLTAPCLVSNTAMYTVYSRCGQYGRFMFIRWPVRPVRGLYGPLVKFRSGRTKVPGNFRSPDLSFRGTFVPRIFRYQELSFLRLFYKALAMNSDSYSNCQNLFRSRPSSVCFPKINWVSLRCVRVVFFC